MLTDPYLCALRACSNTTYLRTRLPAPSYASSIYSTTTTLQAYDEEQHSSRPVTREKLEDKVGFESLDLPQLEGWSLVFTVFSLGLGLVLATLDTTIVATSLLSIASDLGHFDKASWIVVSYFLTYSGFLLVFAQISDVFGKKPVLIFSILMFFVWSIACACAQTIEQLIIFRALLGIAGAGIYVLSYASILDIVPYRLVSAASSVISMCTATASFLGPIIGGVIATNASWRWVFWINVPTSAIVAFSVIFVFPGSFGSKRFASGSMWHRIDWPGVLLSVAGSTLLVIPLEEGGIQFAWKSVPTIVMFGASAICYIAFGGWETLLHRRQTSWKMSPLFPARLLQRRVLTANFCTVFLSGFPFIVVVINLPQRFQIVNADSPAASGLHILPTILTTAVSAAVAGAVTGKFKVAWHLLVLSTALTAIGCGLLSTLHTGEEIQIIGYFYQSIAGLGFGLTLACTQVISRAEVADEDYAIAVGAISQIRQLGGVIGLAITGAVLNHDFRSQLAGVLTNNELASVLLSTSNIKLLGPAHAEFTQAAYGRSSNLQMKIIVSFAVAAFVTSLFARQGVPLNQPTGLGKQTPGQSEESFVRSAAGTSTSTIARPESAYSSRSSLHPAMIHHDFLFQPTELERMGS